MAEQLGPYLLEKRIGSGGMADVFLARGPQGVCVVKRAHPTLCANEEFVRMFLDEASLLAQLHHPNIAQILDLGHAGGQYFLAMEYVPGFDLMTISLEHERTGELMAPELCARIIADAAGALHFAHDARAGDGTPLNLIHRDVTPHNILLSTEGVVKLIDFGVAKASGARHRTQAGLVKGKYPYMSPEQITDQPIDRRVDVYALGLCLYELLTNCRAIGGVTELEQIDAARAARIRPVEQLRSNVPEGLRRILGKCLQFAPDARYPTAAALKADLEQFLVERNQRIGQEDLLRLFRVVAAEVSHLDPPMYQSMIMVPTPPSADSAGTHPTEQEQRTIQGPEDEDVGSAATRQKMPVVSQPILLDQVAGPRTQQEALELPHTQMQLPAQKGSKVALAGVLGVAVVGVLAGVWLMAFQKPSGAGEARTKVPLATLTAPQPDATRPVAELEDDAGAPDPAADARAAAVDAAPDASVDLRAALVPVSATPPCEILVDGRRYGATPMTLELAPGRHVLTLVNRGEHFRRVVPLQLAPGDKRPVAITAKTGTLELNIVPVAELRVNGDLIGKLSFKTLTLYEGRYVLDLRLDDMQLKKPLKKQLTVVIKPGEALTQTVQMLQ